MKLNPNIIFPIPGYDKETYIKPTIKNPNIIVGEFSYFADKDFENHVTHFYPWSKDKLIIGKFVQIGYGVEFMMNDCNHQINSISTYPFFSIPGWDAKKATDDLPYKGDTVVGNDVWIGEKVTILPGVHIGDGAIIGACSVVSKDVEPYTVVVGNPIKVVRKRFDDELIELMLKFKWWDKPVKEINELIPILTNSNLQEVKKYLINNIK